MTSTLKRSISSTETSISPPPLRRRRIEHPVDDQHVKFDNDTASLTRIFSWNVNGVNPLLQKRISFSGSSVFPLRDFLKRHHWPQLLCLQEVKISQHDESTQRRTGQASNAGAKLHEPTYTTHFSLPRDKYNATGFGGKVYGVATLIRDNYFSSIPTTTKPDWDLEGRVLIHELDGDVVVINGYWVNGTTNLYRNSISGTIEGTRHDHKLRFHQNILDACRRMEEGGKHVILVGDMNVARERIDGHPNLRTSPAQHVKNRVDFNSKFFSDPEGLQAVDVLRDIHGPVRRYTYYPRTCAWGQSCDRVDNIIVSRSLFTAGAVTATDICDNPLDRGHSDHVPLWVEVDLSRTSSPVTGSGTQPLT